MSEVGALAGLIATVALIACAILIYHQVQMQRQLDSLQESVRSLGIHMKVPEHELLGTRPQFLSQSVGVIRLERPRRSEFAA